MITMEDERVKTLSADERLLKACSELDADQIRSSLEAGANVNVCDGVCTPIISVVRGDGFGGLADDEDDLKCGEDGDVPLTAREERCKTAIDKKIRCLKLLLDRGADINLSPPHEWSVGFHAVSAEVEVVRFLLENGLDPNIPTEWFGGEPTPTLSYAWDEELINRNDERISGNLRQVVQLLLEYGAVPALQEELDGDVSSFENLRSFEHVPPCIGLSVPMEVKTLTAADKALFAACREHSVADVVNALGQGANPNARDPENDLSTPLLEAIGCCIYDSIEHPSVEEWARWRKDTRTIAELLIAKGADPNLGEVRDVSEQGQVGVEVEGLTPLHQAAWLNKDVELSQFLLEHDANPNVLIDPTEPNTVRDMNDFDYEVGDPIEVKPIEVLLGRFGGCNYYIFDPLEYQELSMADKALVFGCQRMDYFAVMSAVKQGANISLHEWGSRCLPVIVMNDAPQLRGREFARNGWDIEDEICDFVLFLLGGLAMPLHEREVDEMIYTCVDNGFEKVLAAVVGHHKYGDLFQGRGRLQTIGSWPWCCWPKVKQDRMATILKGTSLK